MEIIVKNILVEIHHFMGIDEHHYRLFQHVYSIIAIKIPSIELSLILQMSFKSINNSMGLNRLISTLLVFGIYLKMTKQDILSQSIIHHPILM